MPMKPKPGDVVPVDFPGATGIKRRPAVVVSSDLYHAQRPDVILGIITSNVAAANASTDYVLQDWQPAGLAKPSAFRSYFARATATSIRIVGRLSDRDLQSIRERIRVAFG